jgi:capsid protein
MNPNYFMTGFGTYADGAAVSTRGKPLHDGSADRFDVTFPTKVRKQLNWLAVNNTDIPAMISDATSRTIGINVNVQVESDDEAFNIAAEKFIEYFNQMGVGELSGIHHSNSAFRSMSDFIFKEGGILVRHHYCTAWAIPYKYELVSVDMIDVTKHNTFENLGEIVIGGIVLNKWRQQTHLYLYTDEQKTTSEKIPMKNITYYSDIWMHLGQQIALAMASSILPTLDKIDVYAKAEIDKAIEEAKAGAYLQSTAYNEIMQVLFDKIRGQIGTQDIKNTDLYRMMQEMSAIGVKPQGLTPIPSGDNVLFNNKKTDSVFDSLNKNAEQKMAASQGLSDLGVYSKAGEVNYSALKYINEVSGLKAGIRFDNISNRILNDIYTRVVQVGIQIGKIPNRVKYWANPEKYNRFRYLRQIHIDIEPAKNANANKTNLELGLKTEKEIVEERTGRKYEDFVAEREKAKLFAAKQALETEIAIAQMRKKAFEDAGLTPPEEKEQDDTNKITDKLSNIEHSIKTELSKLSTDILLKEIDSNI